MWLDRPATVPEVAPNPSHPALSVAVQVRDASPVFVSVTVAVVPLEPKSTWSGDTESWAGAGFVEGTAIETGSTSDPGPPLVENVTFAL